MKKYTIVLLSLVCGHAVLATDLPEFPFVYAEGRAITNIAPDVAVIDLKIFCYDKSSSNASASVENRCAELIDSLNDQYGLTSANITASNLRKYVTRNKNNDNEQLEILGYNVSRDITIEVNKIELFPNIMRMLSSTDLITSIDAGFKRSDKDSIISELTTKACQDAHNNATLLAKSSGGELGSLFAISTEGLDNLSIKFRPYLSMGDEIVAYGGYFRSKGETPFFAPDTIKYEAVVATIYKLK